MKKFLNKIFSKQTLNILLVVYLILSIAIVLVFADLQLSQNLNNISTLDLDNHWTVTVNDTTYESVSLDSFRFKPPQRGDIVILEKTLPNDWIYDQPVINIHLTHTALDVYINDEHIYEYGHDRYIDNKTVGSGLEIINLSNDYKGQTLKLQFTVTESNSFSSFEKIYICEGNDAVRYVVTQNRLALFLGTFLVVFGIVVSLITSFAIFFSKKYTHILFLAAFSIFMGFWTLCYHNCIIIFSMTLYSKSLLEYMSLLLMPLPILGYMYNYVIKTRNKKFIKAYIVLFIIQFIVSATSITLHTLDIVHCVTLIPISLFLFGIDAFFFTILLVKPEQEFSRKKPVYVFAYSIILSSLIYDLIIYVLNRYLGLQIDGISGISSLGIITFIGILILDLYYDITTKMMAERERNLLIKRAYTDELTQINNRYFCSEYMNKLKDDNTSNYAIYAFDLNNLKVTNDTFGHAQGDLLITSAAQVISDAFSSDGIVGRMGGDEFIAILPTSDMAKINKLTDKFLQIMADKNAANPNLNLSISYGVATCDEINDNNIDKVYQLADDRMYKYKINYKKTKA